MRPGCKNLKMFLIMAYLSVRFLGGQDTGQIGVVRVKAQFDFSMQVELGNLLVKYNQDLINCIRYRHCFVFVSFYV